MKRKPKPTPEPAPPVASLAEELLAIRVRLHNLEDRVYYPGGCELHPNVPGARCEPTPEPD
ncbi:MAG TPA: hypothetical protein PLB01_00225 [Thermoanaerobaculia bacterium]|nr:hypothetical protein [Thermoanaerobaculia bacterium]